VVTEVLVRLRNLPLRLWARSAAHNAELLREVNLIALAQHDDPSHPMQTVPPFGLVLGLQAQLLGIDEEVIARRERLLDEGVLTQDMDYSAGPGAREASQQLLELFTQADDYCARGMLMTLPSTPEQVTFRQWYLGEFVRQADGLEPLPWTGSLD
jgi:hypothetical protein